MNSNIKEKRCRDDAGAEVYGTGPYKCFPGDPSRQRDPVPLDHGCNSLYFSITSLRCATNLGTEGSY